jgi:hypothetical protein
MILFIVLVMAITLAPTLPVYAKPAGLMLKQDSTGPGDTWYAPSNKGLDWTSPDWIAKLPKYTEATGHQLDTLVSANEPAAPPPAAAPEGVAPSPSNDAPKGPQNPGTLTVYGMFTTPLSGDTYSGANTGALGIAWGEVEVYRCSDNAFLADALTNSYGSTVGQFSVPIANPFANGFYVGIVPDSTAASVRTASGGWDSYATYTSCFYPTADGSYGIGTWVIGQGNNWREAMMIYETAVQDARNWGAWNYFANRLGAYSTNFPQLIIRYPYETWAHYHPGGEMHLPTANDARSPDVIQHEYGHFAMYQTYGTWFNTYCPSPHYITGVSHVNCAWSEGWASYIPYLTHGDKTYTYANNFDVNEETPTWGTSGWDNGDAVEGRVTCALIDMQDTQNEGWDLASGWYLNLWYVFKYKAAPAVVVNYHDFTYRCKLVYGYRTAIVLTNWYNTIYYVDL